MKEIHSALTPAGPISQSIADLYWVMIYVFGGVFFVVMILALLAIVIQRKSDKPRPPLGDNSFIIIGGLLIPALILVSFLIYTLVVTRTVTATPKNALTIEVTGYMWWWEVYYPEADIEIANEIYIPTGRPIHLKLKSKDVIHSLWIPALAGKTDLLPGIENEAWLMAEKPGVYRGQCAEYCGLQHARMSIYVVALEPEKFEQWVNEKTIVRPLPDDPHLKLGHEVFMKQGCAECHAINGTAAQGQVGPDLTHIGSRLSLGAGTIKNSHGNLAGWIAQPQALKPGNKMPAAYIEAEEFEALIDYLRTLK